MESLLYLYCVWINDFTYQFGLNIFSLSFNWLLMDFNSVIICKCICFSLNSYRYSLLPLCWFYMKKKLKYAKKKNVYWVLLSMHKYYALGQSGGWKTSSISFHKSPCCVNSFVKLSVTKWNLISFIWHFGFKKIKLGENSEDACAQSYSNRYRDRYNLKSFNRCILISFKFSEVDRSQLSDVFRMRK